MGVVRLSILPFDMIHSFSRDFSAHHAPVELKVNASESKKKLGFSPGANLKQSHPVTLYKVSARYSIRKKERKKSRANRTNNESIFLRLLGPPPVCEKMEMKAQGKRKTTKKKQQRRKLTFFPS